MRLAHRLSFAFGAFSLLAILYTVFVYLFKDDVVPGWTTMTILVSSGFAGLFLVLGVLGEYLARILVEVRGRPLYAVQSSEVAVPVGVHPPPTPRFFSEQALLDEMQPPPGNGDRRDREHLPSQGPS